jgi:hypothetical protein
MLVGGNETPLIPIPDHGAMFRKSRNLALWCLAYGLILLCVGASIFRSAEFFDAVAYSGAGLLMSAAAILVLRTKSASSLKVLSICGKTAVAVFILVAAFGMKHSWNVYWLLISLVWVFYLWTASEDALIVSFPVNVQ